MFQKATDSFRRAVLSARRATVRTVVGGAVLVGTLEVTTHLPSQGRSSAFYHTAADEWITPAMRRLLDPEGWFGCNANDRRQHFNGLVSNKTTLLPLFFPSPPRTHSRSQCGHPNVQTRALSPTPPLCYRTASFGAFQSIWQDI